MAAAILAPRRAPQPSRLGAACVTEKRPTARQALRGPDGSMHETVDGMLEEFENASTLYSNPDPNPSPNPNPNPNPDPNPDQP